MIIRGLLAVSFRLGGTSLVIILTRLLTYRLPCSDELYAQSIANGRLSMLNIGTPIAMSFSAELIPNKHTGLT